jgi:hypothetical protein
MNNAKKNKATKNDTAAVGLNKRPRPYVRSFSQDDLNWDPEAREQFTFVDGKPVRAGDSFAVVRPDMERWPLGHVSGVYKPTSHRHTVDMILETAGDEVEPFGKPLMSGHGYRVIHQFSVTKQDVEQVHGLPVTSRMTVVHDHSGLHALKARMCIYVGEHALGSVVGARAIHVAENPQRWRVEVDSMVDRSKAAQTALLVLLNAADAKVLNDADRSMLTALGVKPSGNNWGVSLLDAMVNYHRGAAKKTDLTFGVWERRLTDAAVVAMVKMLGQKKYGVALDMALGGKRYGGKFTEEARKNTARAA